MDLNLRPDDETFSALLLKDATLLPDGTILTRSGVQRHPSEFMCLNIQKVPDGVQVIYNREGTELQRTVVSMMSDFIREGWSICHEYQSNL